MMQVASANAVTQNNKTYNCPKCNKSFDKFEEFNNHNVQGKCVDSFVDIHFYFETKL